MDEAPMLYHRREGRHRRGPESRYRRRSARRHDDLRQVDAERAGGAGDLRAGGLLNAPDMYMDKIAVGPGYPDGIVDLDESPGDNIARWPRPRACRVGEITACILDRPRHAELIKAVRDAGAAVRLIPDGDIAGVIWTTDPQETGIDIYMGSGGAPEGVLAAAALRCIGGQIQGRLMPTNDEERDSRAARWASRTSTGSSMLEDMASGDVIFSATGVTDGSLLDGVHFRGDFAETETVVMRSKSGTVRRIKTRFRDIGARFPA